MIAFLILASVAVFLRLPYFMNAYDMNSDQAIVAVQATHLLKGEWSWFLWGCDYQAVFEPLLTAIGFKIFGPHPLVLFLTAFTAYLTILGLTISLLRPRLGEFGAGLAALFLVLCAEPTIALSIYPPRLWSVTSVFLAIWLVDRRSRPVWMGLGGFLIFFALYIDFFAIQFLVPALVFMWFRAKERRALGFGIVVGGVFLSISRWLGPRSGAPLAFSPKTVIKNFPLFVGKGLPRLFGVHSDFQSTDWLSRFWMSNSFCYVLRVAGMLVIVSLLTASFALLVKRKEGKDIGWFGILTVGASMMGFLGSSLVMDAAAVRYLTPIVFASPIAVAPLMREWGVWRVARIALPALIVIALSGWFDAGPRVSGFFPVSYAHGRGEPERELAAALRARGVHFASVNYWEAYRLTFLFGENPIVIPDQRHRDRYLPFAIGFDKAREVAQIFPSDTVETPTPNVLQRFRVGGYTVVTFRH